MATQQPKTAPEPRSLDISSEDLAKIQSARGLAERATVDPEWRAIGELGVHYGWQAVEAVLANTITGEEMTQLLLAARAVNKDKSKAMAQATFIATISGQSKKPGETFKKLMRETYK